MTVDPGSTSLHGAVDWAKFTDSDDIPEWVSKAYADAYQGPHDDEAEAAPGSTDTGPTAGSIAAPAVAPTLLSAHYRLGLHRPAGEIRVAVFAVRGVPAGTRPLPIDKKGREAAAED